MADGERLELSSQDGDWTMVCIEPASSDSIDAYERLLRPTPPIPENTSTMAKVVYKGPEGIFATVCDKLDFVADITAKIGQEKLLSLQSTPVIDDNYVAPYLGTHYRAKLLYIEEQTCLVTLIDLGKELELPIEELRQLPEKFAGDTYTFKLPDTTIAEEGTDLSVKPVFLEDVGSWTILVEDKPEAVDESCVTDPQNVPLPSPHAECRIQVMHVGGIDHSSVPAHKQEALENIVQHIIQIPEGVNNETDEYLVMKSFPQNEDGMRILRVQLVCYLEPSNSPRTLVVPEEPFRPSTPFPENCMIQAKVLYNGPEGIFATARDRFYFLTEATMKFEELLEIVNEDDDPNVTLDGGFIIFPFENEDEAVDENIVVELRDVLLPSPLGSPAIEPSSNLPEDAYTRFRVVHVSIEGAFAVPTHKLETVENIRQQLAQMDHRPLQSPPVVGGFYIAPFDDGLYRAQVLSIDQQSSSCRVIFVDHGRQGDLPIDHLLELSPEFTSNIHTIKFVVDPASVFVPYVGLEIYVKPKSMDENGSCLIDIDDNPQ